jgi:dipeptidyl aminopeptidase/acylaminoacyl peptidase
MPRSPWHRSSGPPAQRGPRPATLTCEPRNLTQRVRFRVLKGSSAAVLVFAAAAAIPAAQSPASKTSAASARPSKHYTIEQFMDTTSVGGASFSADESRILFSSNKTGIWNVYSVPVGGGDWVPVTRSTTDSTYAIAYFPKDDRILFTRDQGGNELNHVYVRTADGQEKDLTPGEKLKAQFAGWTGDLSGFYVSTNERDPKFFDVYRYDAATLERTLFFKNDLGYQPAGISRDGKWCALLKPNTTNDNDIYLWNAATGEAKHITSHTGEAAYRPASFDPQSAHFYYLTNDGSEFMRIKRYSLATGTHEEVEKANWDIVTLSFSFNGKYRVTGVNEDGRYVVRIDDVASNRPVPLPAMPDGNVTNVSIARSEKALAFYVNGDRSPNNLYTLALGSAKPQRLTNSLSADIDPADLVDTQVVRFKSFDGTTIPNILWKPHQATATAKAPALVWVHGGPGGQTTKGYSAFIQYLVNHGYVVLGINNRGSSGYGKTFFAADDQKHGREPLWDCVEAKKYLASLPYVDANRVGIIGGSYGGYMVVAALAFKPDVFDVGVDIFGVTNWVRTLESMPSWWEAQRKALYAELGDPAAQKDMLREISPVFHADKIRKPLLVLQGANDPRVIKAESDDIVAAVKKNNVPVEYIVFPDEGHGFTKKKNEIAGYGAVLKFLDEHLKGKGKPVTSSAGLP